MPNNFSGYPTGPGFERFSEIGFCPAKPYKSFLEGLFSKFEESNFYTNILQFALVSLMYYNVGSGKYWKILFYAGLSGLVGTLFENGTISYVCSENDINVPRYHIYTFIIPEVFWIIKEYSIPFLNLTKMNAFAKGKVSKILNISVYVLFFFFMTARFFIGYERSRTGLLSNYKIRVGHMAAFALTAFANFICTCAILYIVKKNNKKDGDCIKSSNNINNYIKHSSYIILIFVDFVSIFLVIFNCITEYFKDYFTDNYNKPLQSIKCSFILILACDAIIFKYSVAHNSSRDSSNNNRGDLHYGSFNKPFDTSSFNIDIKSSQGTFPLDMAYTSNKISNFKLSNNNSYNYLVDLNDKNEKGNTYPPKNMNKNYSNINSSTKYYDSSPDSEKTYASSFGFLYKKDYY